MGIANYFTFSRILIAPLFLLVYLEHDFFNINNILLPYVLLTLLTISELSDAFDGYLARKYNQVTDFGKVLDPMADSIARTSMFLTFTLDPVNLPVVLIFVLLYRDSIISTLRTVCALKGYALAARTSGKIKAVIQGIAVSRTGILLSSASQIKPAIREPAAGLGKPWKNFLSTTPVFTLKRAKRKAAPAQ